MAEPKALGHRRVRLARTCEQVGWYVQVGAFAEDVRFERLRSRLARDGFETCKAPQTPQNLRLLLVGAYPTRERADQARMRLEKLLGSASYLRHLPTSKHAP
ncbi:sporulation related domain protein [mine drainage metagenome]|uniref:Sporulation related domain protein n=1 Tax=mine drainage metagenome TaxID=410659 RepID=A0A1J5QE08_9ZZZZ